MNFFQQQEKARQKSRWLIIIYLLAVVVIVLLLDAVYLVVKPLLVSEYTPTAGALEYLSSEAENLAVLSLVIIGFIGLASLYRIISLGGGGSRVAASLGGTLVDSSHPDRKVRRLINVVEEMAIASGVPVPQVYVLEQESGINAFAAGYQPEDAVVAVTRGALEVFDRDELQGVIGHEFSHLLNGDMRLNMRLLGPVFGITLIAMMGRLLLRSNRRVRVKSSRGSSGTAVILLVGAGLTIIGFVGQLVARMIKAAISRQREFLADASAVQFTRQKQGIGNALKKIAAWQYGSVVNDIGAEEISHMLFANGLQMQFSRLFATHPQIHDRLERLGVRYTQGEKSQIAERLRTIEGSGKSVAAVPIGEQASAFAVTETAPAVIPGAPGDQELQTARAMIDHIPEKIRADCMATERVRDVVLALLLTEDVDVKRRQLEIVSESECKIDVSNVLLLREVMDLHSIGLRLPVLDLSFPALRRLTYQQQVAFYRLIERIIPVDGEVSSFEYMLSRLMQQMLAENRSPAQAGGKKRLKLSRLTYQLRTLFSVVAVFGHDSIEEARRAYNAGMANLNGGRDWPEFHTPLEWTAHFDAALADLDQARPLIKEEVINSLQLTMAFDGGMRIEEYEMLRVISALMHCPMPILEGDMHWHVE